MRRGLRVRGSKRRLRQIERTYGRERWWILLAILILESLVLTWAIFTDI